MPRNEDGKHTDGIGAPWTVGLTGGIGSGKSTVARSFEALGAHRIDADQLAHEVLEDPAVILEVEEALGSGLKDADGALDRDAIAQRVFSDDASRSLLEAIIHPRVRNRIEDRLAQIARMGFDESSPLPGGRPLILLDIPLLESSPLHKVVDQVLFVDAPDEQREGRVQRARGWRPGERQSREAAQVPLEQKRSAADGVISNPDGVSDEEIEEQCQRFIQQWIDHCNGSPE
ncbi:MAG: dephospho-CoA kinase [Planctomycetota bacterium]|nr:dephospho-CoA kinase [Planctomycetota bacterium]